MKISVSYLAFVVAVLASCSSVRAESVYFRCAVNSGDAQAVEQFLHAHPDEINVRDLNGNTALRSAIYLGYVDVVRVLLNHEVQIDLNADRIALINGLASYPAQKDNYDYIAGLLEAYEHYRKLEQLRLQHFSPFERAWAACLIESGFLEFFRGIGT